MLKTPFNPTLISLFTNIPVPWFHFRSYYFLFQFMKM